jgi:hypothetical protein
MPPQDFYTRIPVWGKAGCTNSGKNRMAGRRKRIRACLRSLNS